APIPQFVNALKIAGIEVSPEQIRQGLTYQVLMDKDGNPFVVGVYNLDPSLFPAEYRDLAGPIPLFIAEQDENGEWGWRNLNSKIAANKKNLSLGVLVGLYPGSPDLGKLLEIQSTYFNSALINVFWSNLQPTNTPIDFSKSGVDYNINFAQKSNMKKSVGIALIWAADAPNWLRTEGFSKEQLTEIMTSHINQVVSRYKGKVGAWIVVNEAYFPPYRTDDVFYKTIGPDYIEIAFKTARETDPSATLLYNDAQNETPYGLTTSHTKKIVDDLKSKGLIDAVGLQMHLDGTNPPSKEDLVATMKSYGLPIYITEFDVNMKDVKGTREERNLIAAEIFRTVIEAAAESGVCNDVFVFQVGDKYSVWENFPGYGFSKDADPTPFDDNLAPKLSYYTMLASIIFSNFSPNSLGTR
ncbi:MAG: endo-1,4-beta-xylanase, partial [Methanothermobacter tenebrarum]